MLRFVTPAVAAISFVAASHASVANAQQSTSVYGQYSAAGGGQIVSTPGRYAGLDASVTLSAGPAVTAQSTASSGPYENRSATANFAYTFSAVGSPNMMVPVSIWYNLYSSASGSDARGYGVFTTELYDSAGALGGDGTNFYEMSCSSVGTDTCPSGTLGSGAFSGVVSGFVPSNTPVWITLQTQAGAGTWLYGGDSSATGFADPQIAILDPNFTLQLPDGIGNETGIRGGVPEPATWAMMLLGFGAMGLAMRRRKNSASPLHRLT